MSVDSRPRDSRTPRSDWEWVGVALLILGFALLVVMYLPKIHPNVGGYLLQTKAWVTFYIGWAANLLPFAFIPLGWRVLSGAPISPLPRYILGGALIVWALLCVHSLLSPGILPHGKSIGVPGPAGLWAEQVMRALWKEITVLSLLLPLVCFLVGLELMGGRRPMTSVRAVMRSSGTVFDSLGARMQGAIESRGWLLGGEREIRETVVAQNRLDVRQQLISHIRDLEDLRRLYPNENRLRDQLDALRRRQREIRNYDEATLKAVEGDLEGEQTKTRNYVADMGHDLQESLKTETPAVAAQIEQFMDELSHGTHELSIRLPGTLASAALERQRRIVTDELMDLALLTQKLQRERKQAEKKLQPPTVQALRSEFPAHHRRRKQWENIEMRFEKWHAREQLYPGWPDLVAEFDAGPTELAAELARSLERYPWDTLAKAEDWRNRLDAALEEAPPVEQDPLADDALPVNDPLALARLAGGAGERGSSSPRMLGQLRAVFSRRHSAVTEPGAPPALPEKFYEEVSPQEFPVQDAYVARAPASDRYRGDARDSLRDSHDDRQPSVPQMDIQFPLGSPVAHPGTKGTPQKVLPASGTQAQRPARPIAPSVPGPIAARVREAAAQAQPGQSQPHQSQASQEQSTRPQTASRDSGDQGTVGPASASTSAPSGLPARPQRPLAAQASTPTPPPANKRPLPLVAPDPSIEWDELLDGEEDMPFGPPSARSAAKASRSGLRPRPTEPAPWEEEEANPAAPPTAPVSAPRRSEQAARPLPAPEPVPTAPRAAPAPEARAGAVGVTLPAAQPERRAAPRQGAIRLSLPSEKLLNPIPDVSRNTAQLDTNARQRGQMINDTLRSFNLQAKVVDLARGPTVTRYEIEPAPGEKISRIASLSNDLARALAVGGVRVEAPVPGKSVIGLEVPNAEREPVTFHQAALSPNFKAARAKLPIILGKSIDGTMMVGDLAKMPHLLVAGSTGSGKSVCVNTLITSLLFKYLPTELRFLMIDPKMVELTPYDGIPHLVRPVVTNPADAAGVLLGAVAHMERRYKMMSQVRAKNLEQFNAKMRQTGDVELPQMVIIIDELADLMITSPKEVESAIMRLAQMARATGMHLILATQRPSVDILTSLIKVNIPARIAFAVSSSHDSRTILDATGAERLTGQGDMLFYQPGLVKPLRLQGPYIDEAESLKITDELRRMTFDDDFVETYGADFEGLISNSGPSGDRSQMDFSDPLLRQAALVCIEEGQGSVSRLQRRLSVGHARAGKLMDLLEAMQIVGPHQGSKPRDVLITEADLPEYFGK